MSTCTANGNYNVTELNLKGTTDPCSPVGFSQISIRCQQPETIQFIQECGSVKDSGKSVKHDEVKQKRMLFKFDKILK
jgi:hypothetical protein